MENIQYHIDIGNLALAVIALVALVAAWRQLRTMQDDSQTQINIAKGQERATRASVLLSLDERFGSQPMVDGRAEIAGVIDRVNKRADELYPGYERKEKRKRAIDLYPDELEKMRTAASPDPYFRLMRTCAFFETVGYVTYSKYVPLDDVLKLFGPSIADAGIVFGVHIKKLREEQNEDLYDNFLWLIEESNKDIRKTALRILN